MPKRSPLPDWCAIARALEILGERWTMLIVRDAFFGVRNFDDFQANLGIARNVLAGRLTMLVETGVLTRTASPDDGRRVEYRLTEMGHDLYPVLVSLGQWGMHWLTDADTPMPFTIVDRLTREKIAPMQVRAADGRVLTSHDTEVVPGPGMTEAIRRTLPGLRDARTREGERKRA